MPVRLELTYDAAVDVAYLSLRPAAPGTPLGPTLLLETDAAFPGTVAMDFALDDGRVVGFEFAEASAILPAPLLVAAERIDGQHVARRMDARLAPLLASRSARTARARTREDA